MTVIVETYRPFPTTPSNGPRQLRKIKAQRINLSHFIHTSKLTDLSKTFTHPPVRVAGPHVHRLVVVEQLQVAHFQPVIQPYRATSGDPVELGDRFEVLGAQRGNARVALRRLEEAVLVVDC